MKLVKMAHFVTGKTADVHPSEVSNFKAGGYTEIDEKPELTREAVAKMGKAELREIIDAHGVEDPPKGIADMRAMVERVLFVSL